MENAYYFVESPGWYELRDEWGFTGEQWEKGIYTRDEALQEADKCMGRILRTGNVKIREYKVIERGQGHQWRTQI